MADSKTSSLLLAFLLIPVMFAATVYWLLQTEHQSRVEQAKTAAKSEFSAVVFWVKEELHRANYLRLNDTLAELVGDNQRVLKVVVESSHGYDHAAFKRNQTSEHEYKLSKDIEFSVAGHSTVVFIYSLSEEYALFAQRLKFASGLVLAQILLIFLVGRWVLSKGYSAARNADSLAEIKLQQQGVLEQLDDSRLDNRRLIAFLMENPDPLVFCDGMGRVRFQNPAYTELLKGLSLADSAQLLPAVHDELIKSTIVSTTKVSHEYGLNGRYLVADYQRVKSVEAVYIYIKDVTEHRLTETELSRERNMAKITLGSIGDAVATTNGMGAVDYLNPAAENIFGVKLDQALGQRLINIFPLGENEEKDVLARLVDRCLKQGETVTSENAITLARADGESFKIQLNASPIVMDKVVLGVALVLRDVTAEFALNERLQEQANRDALTDLLNRLAFEGRIENAIVSAKNQNKTHALCYFDLDQFKVVNDTCGHAAGDELLRRIADLMSLHFHTNDALARIGGDEFAVLIQNCDLDDAYERAEKMRKALQDFAFAWDDKTFRIAISVGITAIDKDSPNMGSLLSQADAACYMAKDAGRNQIYVYRTGDIQAAKHQNEMQWVARLNRALLENSFVLYGQPIVPVSADEYHDDAAIEILLRMVDDDGNLISPGAFLPAAERYDLVSRLDMWVVENAIKFIGEHSKSADLPHRFFINLSGITLGHVGFASFVKSTLKKYGVAPTRLTLEITETAAISNLSSALALIEELSAMGCHFALDDFGTGLSSFAYLKTLPVDYLKIDGNFIRDLPNDSVDRAFVRAIQAVAAEMNIKTIAEFAESDAILEEIWEIGVDFVQGHVIAQPRPLLEIVEQGVVVAPVVESMRGRKQDDSVTTH